MEAEGQSDCELKCENSVELIPLMTDVRYTHFHPIDYKEEEEEEKTFNVHAINGQTNTIESVWVAPFNSDNSNVIIEMEPNNLHQSQSIIHPHKSSKQKDHAHVALSSEFVKPQPVGLLNSCDDNVANCNAIKNIIHLLEFYKRHQTTLLNNEESVIPLFEHISSLKNYGIAIFMDDWYHCKTNHFKTAKDIRYFQSIEAINCDHKSCVYVRRYERDRTRSPQHVLHEEIDYKNMILMDELNSIHTFIFHWVSSRITIME
eukprot:190156_1